MVWQGSAGNRCPYADRPRPQRELRDVTRHRTQLVEEKTRTSNRIEKVLEDANIKLGSVASEVLGVSGRAMIQALLQGEKGPTQIADLAQRQLRGKIPEFEKALEGNLTEHHRFMQRLLWKGLTQQEALIAELEAKIEEVPRPFASEIERLDAVPGVDRRVAEVVLAEVGAKVDPFPTHQHVTAWAGMCPDNEESAGKRRRRRITPGNRWLKRTLVQVARAATHTKNSYLASRYRRLAGRRGEKRALIAVGHSSGSPVITSNVSNVSVTASNSNPASAPDRNFQGRLGRRLAPVSCRTCAAYKRSCGPQLRSAATRRNRAERGCFATGHR